MTEDEYTSVCQRMRLPDDVLWPIPVTLDVSEEFANDIERSGHFT